MDNQPKCVVVTGRPGAGKTTLAGKLSKFLHLPMLSRDEIKEGYVNSFGVSHEQLPANTNKQVNDVFFSSTKLFLESNVSILVEAAFQHAVWEQFIPRWLQISQVYILVCEVGAELSARRHLDRGMKDASRTFYHGDHRVRVFQETGEFLMPGDYIPPHFDGLPTMQINTADGYTPDLDAIKEFIFPV